MTRLVGVDSRERRARGDFSEVMGDENPSRSDENESSQSIAGVRLLLGPFSIIDSGVFFAARRIRLDGYLINRVRLISRPVERLAFGYLSQRISVGDSCEMDYLRRCQGMN